ncbi:translocase of chloroplast 34-like [Trifolium pratense]|uniref:translocase of chloroplast 34-like n=1 Tax=Trifolium pratense TaxID=57577 RepID=UPI001E69377F|nr:translocase of chloroplast 34-like [Trifolium pratense]XP_045797155.1 translocase of chloroplast 34-like [Trifolium pratense]
MTSAITRDWVGFNTFAAATQTQLLQLFKRLKDENVNKLTILVIGKCGVGKSSTINSILGEKAVTVNAFQSEGLSPVMVSRSRTGFILNIIDTPGLIEEGYINNQAMEIIKNFLLNKTIDILLYVDRIDTYRVDNLDTMVIRAITDSFGKEIWKKALIVLTHCQSSPPDGLSYDEFFSIRSQALVKVVQDGTRSKKYDTVASTIPFVLVENSGKCNKNVDDEKVLPNGIAWIPNLVKTIIEVAMNGCKSISVDKKLIEGPNPNDRGKRYIPLILAFQYFFVIKPIQRSIKRDIARH